MWCRVLVAVVLAGVLVWAGFPPVPVSAQGPSLTCDVPFPAGGRAGAASNHDCWLPESGGQGAVPWPSPDSFAEGSVVTVYSLRWSGDGAVRLYCSADSGRGPDYDRWFVAAAVRGGSTIERASYGIRAASVPGGDRLVSSFFGGRDERVEWDRGSRYDAAAGRWVSRSWEMDRSRAAPATPAFMRPAAEQAEPVGGGEAARRPARSGYTCPDFGLLARRMGGRIDGPVGGPGVPARCLDRQGGAGAIFNGDELNVEAEYLPALGRFGGDGGGIQWPNLQRSSDSDGRQPNANRNAQAPRQSRDGVPGGGRRLADAPLVAAFSSGMACVERESLVLRRYRRQRWVDNSYAEYDPACDLSAAGLAPGQSAAGLHQAHCGSEGFDLGGNRVVQSGYWETWWEYVWEANPARTDAHYPWARVFWQDGGGRPGLESGGVIVGDDGTGACLVEQGFVRNPALPGVVPSVTDRLAGSWADYAAGTVSVRCPKEDGSTGFTSAPAGAHGPAFDVLVSLDFAPLVHEEALAESSPARQRRLDSFSRQVRTSAGTGRITSLFVDDPAAMMAHSWDVRSASGLSGRFELDTPWDGGTDVGSGVAAEARWFGPPATSWADCGRRDFLMGMGADSLWGAWVAEERPQAAGDAAGSVGLLGLAEGFDGRAAVSCSAGGDCRPEPDAFVAGHLAIEREARRLYADRSANPSRVCGIGDRVSPPGP